MKPSLRSTVYRVGDGMFLITVGGLATWIMHLVHEPGWGFATCALAGIPQFPPNREIIAIDLSEEMLRRAEVRQKRYPGNLRLVRMDAMQLAFPDASFDTVVTSCTMCSVPALISPASRDARTFKVLITSMPIQYKHQDLAAVGLTPADAAEQVEAAVYGEVVAEVNKGVRRYDMVVRLAEEDRQSSESY